MRRRFLWVLRCRIPLRGKHRTLLFALALGLSVLLCCPLTLCAAQDAAVTGPGHPDFH